MSSAKGPSVRVPLIVFAGDRSLPAQLWGRKGSHATLWCREPLPVGLRCDVMMEGIAAGAPVLVRIEVIERAEPMTHDGEQGHVHLAELAFLRTSDRRKLDVWMRAALAAQRAKREVRTERKNERSKPGGPRSAHPRPTAIFPAGPRRVLLVEGGRSHARELAAALDPGGREFVVEAIWTLSELKGRLSVGRVHLVLLDSELPDSRGLATVKEAVDAARGVPVVVLSEATASGFEVKCLLAGAARVMRKGSLGPELARRVLGMVGVKPPPSPPDSHLRTRGAPSPNLEPKQAAAAPPPQEITKATNHPPDQTPPTPAPVNTPQPTPTPAHPETMVAELWWHQEEYAAIWCTEALRIGMRCELLLDPEESGRPRLYRVEVTRAHHKRAPDGRNGYLHEASMALAPAQSQPPAPAPAPARASAPHVPAPRPREGAPFRLVLVENNPSHGPSPMRRQLGRMEGVLIETRSSLAGLRARLRRDGVHLVLLELDLPDSQGLDTARAALGYAEGVPVVAVVANPAPELDAACGELGVMRVVDKDLERAALHELIRGFMGR